MPRVMECPLGQIALFRLRKKRNIVLRICDRKGYNPCQ